MRKSGAISDDTDGKQGQFHHWIVSRTGEDEEETEEEVEIHWG